MVFSGYSGFVSDLRWVGGFHWILRVCQWFTTGRWFSLDTPGLSVIYDGSMVFSGYSGFVSDLQRVGGFLWILRVCQWFTTGRWFSLDTPVFSSNKTYRHDIILFKLVLSTITLTPLIVCLFGCFHRTRDHPKAFFTQR